MAEWAFVALGSNMGDREAVLREAKRHIAALEGTEVIAASAVEETEPLGPIPQSHYLNQMLLLRTILGPRDLLEALLAIERRMGRVRAERWGPRVIDLDIVRYDAVNLHEPGLDLPHPELPHRGFWQRELAELLPHVA
ncbi:MAG: 2-amino-4-hydroxy-6-hydroxymethyldihydropteridine diphosphokinase [Gemmatimonadetes bacterium]|nr:2-amino-4-hydroxy-6-hydroxymethyldihydropteridine diphosphokinase [Gemmatimonadota bacterium]